MKDEFDIIPRDPQGTSDRDTLGDFFLLALEKKKFPLNAIQAPFHFEKFPSPQRK